MSAQKALCSKHSTPKKTNYKAAAMYVYTTSREYKKKPTINCLNMWASKFYLMFFGVSCVRYMRGNVIDDNIFFLLYWVLCYCMRAFTLSHHTHQKKIKPITILFNRFNQITKAHKKQPWIWITIWIPDTNERHLSNNYTTNEGINMEREKKWLFTIFKYKWTGNSA